MRFSPEHKNPRAMIPPSHRCIWMTAGILSYQLCDRAFDCDRCPLDAAMRMHFGSGRHRASHKNVEPGASGTLHYSANHCWISSVSSGIFRVGIVPVFSSLISPKEIILPRTGDSVSSTQYCWWIALEGGTLSFTSPVRGTISAINRAVTTDPGRIRVLSPVQEWLFEVKQDTGVNASLMEKKDADMLYSSEHLRFTQLIHDAITKHTGVVGTAFPDGGEVLLENSAILGAEKYFEILERVFGEKVLPIH